MYSNHMQFAQHASGPQVAIEAAVPIAIEAPVPIGIEAAVALPRNLRRKPERCACRLLPSS